MKSSEMYDGPGSVVHVPARTMASLVVYMLFHYLVTVSTVANSFHTVTGVLVDSHNYWEVLRLCPDSTFILAFHKMAT